MRWNVPKNIDKVLVEQLTGMDGENQKLWPSQTYSCANFRGKSGEIFYFRLQYEEKVEANKCDVTSIALSDLCRGCLGLGEAEIDSVMIGDFCV